MIEAIRLTNFKNFRDATLPLGRLTLLVGTNASGKSNLRDGFRFLHGMARGYALAEIIGEKYIDRHFLQLDAAAPREVRESALGLRELTAECVSRIRWST